MASALDPSGFDTGQEVRVEIWTATGPGVGVTLCRGATGTTIIVEGEVDVSSARLLRDALDEALLLGGRVTFDLSPTTFMDSSGLAVLVDAYNRSGRLREAVTIQAPSRVVRRLLNLSGLDRLLPIIDLQPTEPGPHPKLS